MISVCQSVCLFVRIDICGLNTMESLYETDYWPINFSSSYQIGGPFPQCSNCIEDCGLTVGVSVLVATTLWIYPIADSATPLFTLKWGLQILHCILQLNGESVRVEHNRQHRKKTAIKLLIGTIDEPPPIPLLRKLYFAMQIVANCCE